MKYFTQSTYTEETLKKEYRQLSMKLHPDKNNGADEEFKAMNTEYETALNNIWKETPIKEDVVYDTTYDNTKYYTEEKEKLRKKAKREKKAKFAEERAKKKKKKEEKTVKNDIKTETNTDNWDRKKYKTKEEYLFAQDIIIRTGNLFKLSLKSLPVYAILYLIAMLFPIVNIIMIIPIIIVCVAFMFSFLTWKLFYMLGNSGILYIFLEILKIDLMFLIK